MKIKSRHKAPPKYNIVLIITICLLCSQCSSVYKYLEEDEILLTSQEIAIEEEDIADELNTKNDLSALVQPKTNKKFLFHRNRLRRFLKKRKDNPDYEPGRREEYAVLADSSRFNETSEKLKRYLTQNAYFDATVDYEVKYRKQNAQVSYNIALNKRLLVDTVSIWSADTAIQKLLTIHRDEQILKKGQPLSQDLYKSEVNRVVNLMRDNGYASFLPNYIDLIRSDTLGNASIEIFQLYDSLPHPTYHVGPIDVYLNQSNQLGYTNADTVDNIIFHYAGETPYIDVNLLSQKIKFKNGEPYSKSAIDRSRILLGSLPAIRKINITPTPSTSEDTLQYNLELFREQRYAWNTDLSLAYAFVTGNINRAGISGTVGLTDRNFLNRGIEARSELQLGLEATLLTEGASSENAFTNNRNFQFNNRFAIPDFRDLTGSYWVLNKLKIFCNNWYNEFKESGITTARANTQFVGFADYFSYWNVEFDLFQRTQYKNWILRFTQSSVSAWIPSLSQDFLDDNMNNQDLVRSFDPRLITGLGIIPKNIDLQYAKTYRNGRSGFNFLGNIDFSGLEMYAINGLANLLTDHTGGFQIDDLQFAHYAKLNLEARWFKQVNTTQSLHFRAQTGIVRPFGFSGQVPYVAQFGIGGPYSIRAWDIRELGPGASIPDGNIPVTFANKGDFKIELNLEYRFPIWWLWKGAFFVDAGNVWNITSDNPAENLSWNFYDQVAVGAGWGLRFDYYDYFVVRFDFGYRFRQPFNNPQFPDQGQWLFEDIKLLKNTNFVIGVGYPF